MRDTDLILIACCQVAHAPHRGNKNLSAQAGCFRAFTLEPCQASLYEYKHSRHNRSLALVTSLQKLTRNNFILGACYVKFTIKNSS